MSTDELKHYGVLGMHWGIRRYQPYPEDAKNKGVYKADKRERKRLEERANIAGRYRTGYARKIQRMKSKGYKNIPNDLKKGHKFWNDQYNKEYKVLTKHVDRMIKTHKDKKIKEIPLRDVKIGKDVVNTMYVKNSHDFGSWFNGGLPGIIANESAKAYEANSYSKAINRDRKHYKNDMDALRYSNSSMGFGITNGYGKKHKKRIKRRNKEKQS